MNPKISRNKVYNGFTLLELIVATTIVAMTAAWTIPEFQRNSAQAKVDRYTKNLESGLFSIRARMGAIKESCEINFYQDVNGALKDPSFSTEKYYAPSDLIEVKQDDGSSRADHALAGCINEVRAKDINQELRAESIRIVNMEGTRERDAVVVRSMAKTFSFTPPGTTANDNDMTILIRSVEALKPWATKTNGSSRLVTRCIEVTGNGQIFSGKWISDQCLEN